MENPDGPVGIICAGGTGQRLWPLTLGVNKHLLPVFNKPLIHYPISVLMLMGVREVIVVTNAEARSSFEAALSNGSQWGLDLRIRVQSEPNGIVGCVLSVADEIRNRALVLILGDNFFYGSNLARFLQSEGPENNAIIFTTEVADPRPFAVVERDDTGHVVSLAEKPEFPRSSEVATGLYSFPSDVVERARTVAHSARGELEVTDLLQTYVKEQRISARVIPRGSIWFDCGTHNDLLRASSLVQVLEELQGIRIGSLEELAWRRDWIDRTRLLERLLTIPDSNYRRYLEDLID